MISEPSKQSSTKILFSQNESQQHQPRQFSIQTLLGRPILCSNTQSFIQRCEIQMAPYLARPSKTQQSKQKTKKDTIVYSHTYANAKIITHVLHIAIKSFLQYAQDKQKIKQRIIQKVKQRNISSVQKRRSVEESFYTTFYEQLEYLGLNPIHYKSFFWVKIQQTKVLKYIFIQYLRALTWRSEVVGCRSIPESFYTTLVLIVYDAVENKKREVLNNLIRGDTEIINYQEFKKRKVEYETDYEPVVWMKYKKLLYPKFSDLNPVEEAMQVEEESAPEVGGGTR